MRAELESRIAIEFWGLEMSIQHSYNGKRSAVLLEDYGYLDYWTSGAIYVRQILQLKKICNYITI